MADKLDTRLTVGNPTNTVRFSFLRAHVPEEVTNDDGVVSLKYSTMVIIPKKDVATIAAINTIVKGLVDEHFKGKTAMLKLPLRDGDEEDKGDAVKGCWFFNCSSKMKPQVVGTEKNDLTGKLEPLGPDEIKSGDYGRISVNFFHFIGKSKGIGVGLGNIQKLKDGESLGNQHSADDDFADIAGGFAD